MSRQPTLESLYAATGVLGLTLSLLVVLANSARTPVLAPLIVGGLGGSAAVVALSLVADGRTALQLTLVVWLGLPAITRLLRRDASA